VRPASCKAKAALITGGDSGIGRAVALLYAREGAKVAISCLPEERSDAEETQRAIEGRGGQCRIFPGDLTDKQYCSELVETTVRELGSLDILVSNAAHQSRKQKLEDVSDEEIERTFDTNIFAYMRLARTSLKHMKAGSCIIATSSETGIMGSEKFAGLFSHQRLRSMHLRRHWRRP
jgi:NAD(P)-dependent dehydrogenase (short-subunit alcohol dehydrogenase family)